MLKYKIYLGIFLSLFLPLLAYAQPDSTMDIAVQARVQKDAILLRWGATKPAVWKQTNKYGFRVERYTVVRDGQILPQAERKDFPLIKAQPLARWEGIVQQNNYAAIIAQALYGDDFSLTSGQDGIAKIIAMSQELEQRFAISLYAADQSFEAALMAGWGYRDTDVKSGERYLYRIIPALPENSNVKIEMGAVYISIDEYEELPKPIGLSGLFGDKSVLLSWNYSMLNNVYNSYFVEKSTDGKTFNRLDGLPLTNLNSVNNQPSPTMYFTDSLPDNTTTIYYRIRGTTAFGEEGQPSDTVSGQGKAALIYVPQITQNIINNKGELELAWEFNEAGNPLISKFTLNRSDFSNRGFVPVIDSLPPQSRSVVYADLNASNYFTVKAIGKDGNTSESFPVFVQPLDTVPPAIPIGLQGVVDSTGIVTLTWKPNTESDLLGYKLYRAQTKGEELIVLFDVALQDTIYRDTVNIKNLNRMVYYAVSAADKRYNQSNQSAIIEVKKPDIIHPSAPVITGYTIKDEGIEITWINSPDKGILQHRIYRREVDESKPNLLKIMDDTSVQSYTDTTVQPQLKYAYTVTAVKDNWYESRHSQAVTLSSNKAKAASRVINRFDAVVDKTNRMIKLTWTDKLTNVVQYEIYRKEGDTPMVLWKTLPPQQYEALDDKVYINTQYQYTLRAILKNGNTPAKNLTINY